MKLTAKYNLKKGIVMGLLAALPMFNACEKPDPAPEPTPVTPTPVTPTQQRVEEFKYDANLYFYREGSSDYIPRDAFADTAAKYAIDQNVKQIHIVPSSELMLGNISSTTSMENKANALDVIYNQSNNKLSGENTTLYLDSVVLASQTVQDIFHGKLKINLVQR